MLTYLALVHSGSGVLSCFLLGKKWWRGKPEKIQKKVSSEGMSPVFFYGMGFEYYDSLLDGWIGEQQWVIWASYCFEVVAALNSFHN